MGVYPFSDASCHSSTHPLLAQNVRCFGSPSKKQHLKRMRTLRHRGRLYSHSIFHDSMIYQWIHIGVYSHDNHCRCKSNYSRNDSECFYHTFNILFQPQGPFPSQALSQALEPGTQAPAAPSIEIPSAPMRKSSSVAKMKRRIIGATVPVPRRDGIGGALSGGAAGW